MLEKEDQEGTPVYSALHKKRLHDASRAVDMAVTELRSVQHEVDDRQAIDVALLVNQAATLAMAIRGVRDQTR